MRNINSACLAALLTTGCALVFSPSAPQDAGGDTSGGTETASSSSISTADTLLPETDTATSATSGPDTGLDSATASATSDPNTGVETGLDTVTASATAPPTDSGPPDSGTSDSGTGSSDETTALPPDDGGDFVPELRAVEPFGYGEVRQVLVYAAAEGRTGGWWCTNHFGNNLGGVWSCQGVSGQGACDATVAQGELVSCVRAAAPANVDEAPFAPPACDSAELDASSQAFCQYTEYMTTRASSSLYLYNDWVRVGVSRSFGGTVTELYGTDKHNRIEQHGGSAIQLSLWAYDGNGGPPKWFTTKSCNGGGFDDAAACKSANEGTDCRLFATGAHVVDCVSERACLDWSAAGPWNPIQAQASDCGWNGPTNDVDSVASVDSGVQLTKQSPYHFTKTGSFAGLVWSTTVRVLSDRPYVQIDYEWDYTGAHALSAHNQEIPALFTDDRLGAYYYFYPGSRPYADAGSNVTRIASGLSNAQIRLPGRTGELPQPPANTYFDATEEWLSTCDASEQRCMTLVSFSSEHGVFVLGGQYVTPLGRFSFAGQHSQRIYLFPYRFDDVVAGRTVREWIYELKGI